MCIKNLYFINYIIRVDVIFLYNIRIVTYSG